MDLFGWLRRRPTRPTITVVELPRSLSLVGEGHRNKDGTERQAVIAELRAGQFVRLAREPDNPYDSNAVAVFSRDRQIGYLARKDAVSAADWLDSGLKIRGRIWKITGGTEEKPSRGVLLDVEWDVPG